MVTDLFLAVASLGGGTRSELEAYGADVISAVRRIARAAHDSPVAASLDAAL